MIVTEFFPTGRVAEILYLKGSEALIVSVIVVTFVVFAGTAPEGLVVDDDLICLYSSKDACAKFAVSNRQ